MAKYLLEPTTSATQSKGIVGDIHSLPLHLTAPGLAGSEAVTVQKQSASGNWSDYIADGATQQVTATNTGVAIYAPGIYRGSKSATAAAVGVEVSTLYNP
jgi:hypothetical protein